MTAVESAKHHYIPEFFLRWWTGGDGRLERYTRPTASKINVKRVFPCEAGFIRDLYQTSGAIDRDRQWLEKRFFQRVDSMAAKVLRKLNAATPPSALNAADMTSWSIFIRTLHSRTPLAFSEYRQSGYMEWLRVIDEVRDRYSDLRGPNDPETYAAYRALQTPEMVDDLVLRTLPSTLTGEHVGTFLNAMPKRWFDIPHDLPKLLISDAVLIMTNGLQVEGGHYAIPLSPTRLLVAAYEQKTLDQITQMPRRQVVKAVNQWTVERARYFVAAQNRNQDRFIRNRFGKAVG